MILNKVISFSDTQGQPSITSDTYALAPVSLSVSGSWEYDQCINSDVNTAGLTFIVTYNDNSSVEVFPEKSPSVWGSSTGTQTCLFTYTEGGVSVSTSKSATITTVKLSSLEVGGTWSNTQYATIAPDITGLTFTAHFNNGTTSSISPSNISVSPSTWSSTVGTQTATFYYTSGGITKSTTKTATVSAAPELPKVGGIIFYIDNSGDGTYTFKNASGQVVPAPTVGTDCTNWTYMVTGATKDKYYVVYNQIYPDKTWGNIMTWYSTSTAIGSGRRNTNNMSSGYGAKDQIISMNNSKVGGCNDWFIGSYGELDKLRTSNAGSSSSWFIIYNIWSSSTSGQYYTWVYIGGNRWESQVVMRSDKACVCAIRAF